MKTHNKITSLLFAIIIIIISFIIVLQLLKNQENEVYFQASINSDRKVIDKVMEFKDQSYLKSTEDNATWNDMVKFLSNRDTAWAKNNLYSILKTIEISYIGIYDTNGVEVYSQEIDSFKNFTIPKSWFETKKKMNFIKHKFIYYDGKLLEVFGSKIVPSDDLSFKSKTRGFLISAVEWNAQSIRQLEQATGFQIELIKNYRTSKVKSAENQKQWLLIMLLLITEKIL